MVALKLFFVALKYFDYVKIYILYFLCLNIFYTFKYFQDEQEEKARLIAQVLELQNTLDDLTHRVDKVSCDWWRVTILISDWWTRLRRRTCGSNLRTQSWGSTSRTSCRPAKSFRQSARSHEGQNQIKQGISSILNRIC